jgi:type IV secretory pathway VirB10-like protein
MNDPDLDEVYRRAAASDPVRPSREARRSILSHAARLAAARSPRSFAARSIHWLARLWVSLQRRSWQILAPLAAAAVAVAVLVPMWRSPRPLDATSISDEEAPAVAPRPPTAAAPPAPAAPMPARAAPPVAAPNLPAATAAAASSMAASNARAQSAASGASRARTQQPSSRDRDTAMRQIQRAALSGDTESLARLLNAHPELIDTGDELGRTPLMLATLDRQAATVAMLLAHGANPNTPDSAGRTPLEVARAQGEAAISAELARPR